MEEKNLHHFISTLPSGAPLKLRRSETLDMNIINIFSSCVRINILILSVRMIVNGDNETCVISEPCVSVSTIWLFTAGPSGF